MIKKIITAAVFLVLGVLGTVAIAVIGFVNNVQALSSGFPFKFTSVALLIGESHTNYLSFFLDVVIWAIILYGVWILIKKLLKK